MDIDIIGMRLSDELEVVTPDMLKGEEEQKPLLPVPTVEYVKAQSEEWKRTEPFSSYERAMERLFEALPENGVLEDVLPKVAVVNEFCAQNIRAVVRVAEHIVDCSIDEKVERGDLRVCEEIAVVKMPNDREYTLYGFATKYLAHIRPDYYPEYDTYAVKTLVWYRDKDDFSRFLIKELREYSRFRQIVLDFRRKYGLEECSLREIHRFLWLTGRKYFNEKKEGPGARRYQ